MLEIDLRAERYHIGYHAGGEYHTLQGPLLWSELHYGGGRWWWGCPHCARRVRVLYRPASARRFACRHCHRIGYSVQRLTHHDRLLRRSYRLFGKAGSPDGGRSHTDKPKGMHWRTFDRLCDDAEAAFETAFNLGTGRLFARIRRRGGNI